MNFKNPFKLLSKFELFLYIFSMLSIALSFLAAENFDPFVTTAPLIGTTALIFVAKGEPIGQILTVIFSLFYAFISFSFRYYGEMITYLGMTAPIAVMASVQWIKNPYEKGKSEVKVNKLSAKNIFIMWILTILSTVFFHYILKYFNTPNLFFSTVSISTSFLASYLTLFRSPFYAVAYAANDIVLIILWILASLSDTVYVPMVVCFIIFLLNDSYGFFNWKRIKSRQNANL